jgi:DNA-binding transcriptional regulator LsrR (DeoR family)
VLKAFKPQKPLKVDVVQILGATGSRDFNTDGMEIARSFAGMLNGACHLLQTPLVVQNKLTRDLLLNEPDIAQPLRLAEQADVVVIGIGSSHHEVSALVRAGYLTREESDKMLSIGAVGDICGRPIDILGNPLAVDLNDRIVGIELDKLKKIPRRIGVAAGTQKGEAVLGAIRGGYVNALVIDEGAALSLLSHETVAVSGRE